MIEDEYKSIKTQEKDYLWTVLAGLVNASEAIIMSMIATRIELFKMRESFLYHLL